MCWCYCPAVYFIILNNIVWVGVRALFPKSPLNKIHRITGWNSHRTYINIFDKQWNSFEEKSSNDTNTICTHQFRSQCDKYDMYEAKWSLCTNSIKFQQFIVLGNQIAAVFVLNMESIALYSVLNRMASAFIMLARVCIFSMQNRVQILHANLYKWNYC